MARHFPRWTPARIAGMAFTVALLLMMPRFMGIFGRQPAPGIPHLSLRGSGAGPGTSDDTSIESLQGQLRDEPHNFPAYLSLAHAYLQKVRETGDPSYYTKTEALLKQAALLSPGDADLLATEGMLALARHDFAGGLKLGQQAVALHPESARFYGVVADAQIELGQYDAAWISLQKMVERRPDYNSYTRISYARELQGDTRGAIDAMQRAITAGSAVPENAAWAYVQLGNLWFGKGDLQQAQTNYDLAVQLLPDYAAGVAGKARIAAAQGNLPQAAELYGRAFARMPLAEYAIALGDIDARRGDRQQAQRQYDLVTALDRLLAANGVNTDLETALFFADHGIDPRASLQKARAAYAARPSIQTADGLAWTLYKTGQAQEAQRYTAEALRLGTQDALKLFHAGMIARAVGQKDQARIYLTHALALNPYFSLIYSDEAATALRELGTPKTVEGTK